MTCQINLYCNYRYNIIKDLNDDKITEAVNWNPESGYPSNLPDNFYPRPAAGIYPLMFIQVFRS